MTDYLHTTSQFDKETKFQFILSLLWIGVKIKLDDIDYHYELPKNGSFITSERYQLLNSFLDRSLELGLITQETLNKIRQPWNEFGSASLTLQFYLTESEELRYQTVPEPQACIREIKYKID